MLPPTLAAPTLPLAWQAPAVNVELKTALKDAFAASISEAYTIVEKQSRYTRLDEIKQQALAQFAAEENAHAHHFSYNAEWKP